MSSCVVGSRVKEKVAVDKLHPVSVEAFLDVEREAEMCPDSWVELSSTWHGVDERAGGCVG